MISRANLLYVIAVSLCGASQALAVSPFSGMSAFQGAIPCHSIIVPEQSEFHMRSKTLQQKRGP